MTSFEPTKKIVANLIDPEEIRIAILDERGKLYDFFVERMLEHQRTGEIYKARLDSVLPGMHSAFLNLGDGRNGFKNSLHPTAPEPGPPPPCGVEKVLCRFRWTTSNPISPGRTIPMMALRFAPS